MKKINRVGEKKLNNQGLEMEIIDYNTCEDITIKISKYNEIIHCKYRNFNSGQVASKYYPSVYGKGFLGNSVSKENGVFKKSYTTWRNMIKRCYSDKFQKKMPSYIGCEVCEEWLSYEIFEKWYNENYYEVESRKMNLDKDILFKNNKVYSPKRCVFVPDLINTLFTKSNTSRGNYPIGVYKNFNKYRAIIEINGKKESIGTYDTVEEAFNVYKTAKEKYIKEVADMYKNYIPEKLYNAMYNYEVEIDD